MPSKDRRLKLPPRKQASDPAADVPSCVPPLSSTEWEICRDSHHRPFGYDPSLHRNRVAGCGFWLAPGTFLHIAATIWAENDAIRVYDLKGDYVALIQLPRAGYGFSLSYCHGYLWIAKDADGGEDGADGRWYGYKLK